MKNRNVQIPYELFFQLLQYFLMENYESEEIIRQGLEESWIQWSTENYTANIKLHRQRKNGKNPGRNIWTGGEDQRTFDGKDFL